MTDVGPGVHTRAVPVEAENTEHFEPHIFIADTIDTDPAPATAAAAALDASISRAPESAVEAIAAGHGLLQEPGITADRLRSLPLDGRRMNIAAQIANLLSLTNNGKYIDFSDTVYDWLQQDSRHQRLAHDVRTAGKRNEHELAVRHRRVVLSGLVTVAEIAMSKPAPGRTSEAT